MRSEFLENEADDYSGGGIPAVLGSLYGWSTLDMLDEFSKTGEYYVPWSKMFGKKISVSAVNKPWGIVERAPMGERLAMRAAGTISRDQYKNYELGRMFLGKYAGASRLGTAELALSKAVGFGMTTIMWTDPVFFAFVNITNPAMLAVGAAYFGGGYLVKGLARAARSDRYVRMSRGFADTQGSFTSRQRAVRAISESHLQARSAIGNEAMLMHRGTV